MGLGKFLRKAKPVIGVGVALSGQEEKINAFGKLLKGLGIKKVTKAVDKVGKLDG